MAAVRHATTLASLGLLLSACGNDPLPGDGSSTLDAGTASTDPDTETTGSAPTTSPGTSDGSTGPADDTDSTPTSDSTGMDGESTTGDESSGGTVDQLPPTHGDELLPWLESGEYLGWTGESAMHPSAGPHFAGVWTYVNDALLGSLEAGEPPHPMGAAAVKELYDGAGVRQGWAVMVKVQADSAGGDGWYWYETFDGDVFADGTGAGICTGCHSGGTDYVLTPFPLQ